MGVLDGWGTLGLGRAWGHDKKLALETIQNFVLKAAPLPP